MRYLLAALLGLVLTGCQPPAQISQSHPPVDLARDSRPEMRACKDAYDAEDASKTIAVCSHALETPGLSARDKAALLVLRGKAYGSSDDNVRAMADLNASIGLDPGDAAAYSGRAGIYNNLHQYADGLNDAERAVRMQPDMATAYLARARANSGLGASIDKVLADQDEAIRLDPNYAVAFSNRAAVYAGAGRLDRAITDLDKAIALDPKLVVAYQNRGVIRLYQGDPDAALSDFNKAMQLAPDHAEPYFDRARVYALKGDRRRASADLERAISMNPDQAYYYVLRAELHFTAGDKAAADLDCQEARKHDPANSAMIAYNLKAPAVVCVPEGAYRIADDDAPDDTPSEYSVHPDGIEAKPGQYAGYLDWNAKQVFTAKGLTPQEMTAVVSCTNAALYRHLTPAEQTTLDAAARGNGMSGRDVRTFWAAVDERLGRDETRRITDAACHEQDKALSKLFDKP